MKFSYTFVVLLIIQLALKYVKASVGSKDMTCENATLVQYGNSYECKCLPNHTHETETKCIKNEDVIKTCTSATDKAICGPFAKCGADPNKPTEYKCLCLAGYSKITVDTKSVCVPTVCTTVNCGKGVCVSDNGKALCSCHINHKHKTEGDKTSECEEGGQHTCDLTCVANAHCQIHKDGYYFCECINKKPMENGVCSNAITSFLSPLNVLLIIGVYIIYMKTA